MAATGKLLIEAGRADRAIWVQVFGGRQELLSKQQLQERLPALMQHAKADEGAGRKRVLNVPEGEGLEAQFTSSGGKRVHILRMLSYKGAYFILQGSLDARGGQAAIARAREVIDSFRYTKVPEIPRKQPPMTAAGPTSPAPPASAAREVKWFHDKKAGYWIALPEGWRAEDKLDPKVSIPTRHFTPEAGRTIVTVFVFPSGGKSLKEFADAWEKQIGPKLGYKIDKRLQAIEGKMPRTGRPMISRAFSGVFREEPIGIVAIFQAQGDKVFTAVGVYGAKTPGPRIKEMADLEMSLRLTPPRSASAGPARPLTELYQRRLALRRLEAGKQATVAFGGGRLTVPAGALEADGQVLVHEVAPAATANVFPPVKAVGAVYDIDLRGGLRSEVAVSLPVPAGTMGRGESPVIVSLFRGAFGQNPTPAMYAIELPSTYDPKTGLVTTRTRRFSRNAFAVKAAPYRPRGSQYREGAKSILTVRGDENFHVSASAWNRQFDHEARARAIHGWLKEARAYVANDLRIDPDGPEGSHAYKMHVVASDVVPPKSANPFKPSTYETYASRKKTKGYYVTNLTNRFKGAMYVDATADDADLRETIFHEYLHAVQAKWRPGGGHDVRFNWLDEATAVAMERLHFGPMDPKTRTRPMPELTKAYCRFFRDPMGGGREFSPEAYGYGASMFLSDICLRYTGKPDLLGEISLQSAKDAKNTPIGVLDAAIRTACERTSLQQEWDLFLQNLTLRSLGSNGTYYPSFASLLAREDMIDFDASILDERKEVDVKFSSLSGRLFRVRLLDRKEPVKLKSVQVKATLSNPAVLLRVYHATRGANGQWKVASFTPEKVPQTKSVRTTWRNVPVTVPCNGERIGLLAILLVSTDHLGGSATVNVGLEKFEERPEAPDADVPLPSKFLPTGEQLAKTKNCKHIATSMQKTNDALVKWSKSARVSRSARGRYSFEVPAPNNPGAVVRSWVEITITNTNDIKAWTAEIREKMKTDKNYSALDGGDGFISNDERGFTRMTIFKNNSIIYVTGYPGAKIAAAAVAKAALANVK